MGIKTDEWKCYWEKTVQRGQNDAQLTDAHMRLYSQGRNVNGGRFRKSLDLSPVQCTMDRITQMKLLVKVEERSNLGPLKEMLFTGMW